MLILLRQCGIYDMSWANNLISREDNTIQCFCLCFCSHSNMMRTLPTMSMVVHFISGQKGRKDQRNKCSHWSQEKKAEWFFQVLFFSYCVKTGTKVAIFKYFPIYSRSFCIIFQIWKYKGAKSVRAWKIELNQIKYYFIDRPPWLKWIMTKPFFALTSEWWHSCI